MSEAVTEPGQAYENLDSGEAGHLSFKYKRRRNTAGTIQEYGIDKYDLTVATRDSLEKVYDGMYERQEGNWVALGSMDKFEAEGDGVMMVPYTNRTSDKYRYEVGDKFDAIEGAMKYEGANGVALSLSPRLGPEDSIHGQMELLSEVTNKLMAFITERKGERLPFVWIIEPQKSGNPHYHFLFPTINYLMPFEDLAGWWGDHGYGSDPGVDVRHLKDDGQGAEDFKNYMVKYLKDQTGQKAFIGYLGLSGKRGYTISHNCMDWVVRMAQEAFNVELEGDGAFEAAVRLFRLGEIKREDGGEYTDWFYIGKVSDEMAEEIRDQKPPPHLLKGLVFGIKEKDERLHRLRAGWDKWQLKEDSEWFGDITSKPDAWAANWMEGVDFN